MNKKFVIIGSSAGGIAAARTLARLAPNSAIVMISREKELPYNKCFIADYIAKDEQQQLFTTNQRGLPENVQLLLGTSVANIDANKQHVVLDNQETITYDALLVATGARARKVELFHRDNNNFNNLFYYHNLWHAQLLKTFIAEQKPKQAIVIGGGISAVEAADALHQQGIAVTIVNRGKQLLSRYCSSQMITLLYNRMQQLGAHVVNGAQIIDYQCDNDRITSVLLDNGQQIKTDLVMSAIGVQANSELLQSTSVALDNDLVNINQYLQTSVPTIYAAGDVTLVHDRVNGLKMRSCTWPDAMQQGMIAAHNMVGKEKVYDGAVFLVDSHFFGFDFVTCGVKNDNQVIRKKGNNWFHEFEYNDDNQLLFFAMLGNTELLPNIKRLYLTREPLSVA